MVKGETFKNPGNGSEYRIKYKLTYRHDYVIYVLQCPCPLLYVGETPTECRIRFNNHKSTILTRKVELPVPRHFVECGHKLKKWIPKWTGP